MKTGQDAVSLHGDAEDLSDLAEEDMDADAI